MRKIAFICMILIAMCPLVGFASANTTHNIGSLQFDLPNAFYLVDTSEDDDSVNKSYQSSDGDTAILATMIIGHTCNSMDDATFLCNTYIDGILDTDIDVLVTESQSVPGSYYSAHVGQRIFSGDLTWCGVFLYATSDDVYMLTYIRSWDKADGAGDEFYDIYKSAKYDGVSIYGESVSPAAEMIDEPASNPQTDVTAIDLSDMTLDELVALREQVTMAMWETDEWQEVEVPIGVYQVGVDIPAGNWTIKCHKSFDRACISWGEILNADGHSIAWQGRNDILNYVYNPDYKYYEEGDGPLEYTFEARDGEYIVISYGNVIFTPFTGKPDLGFK